MISREEVFKIGQFAKPHGIKGEITLNTQCDVFDESDDPYIICDMNGILVPFFIEDYRYKSDSSILVKLEGIDSEVDAREFVNKEVYYSLDEVDEDSIIGGISWDNFIGYHVVDKNHGDLGPIVDVDETTMNVLLQIDHEGEELLLPAAEDLISDVDHEKKIMSVSLPAGLLDL